jgi:hypothetical protein
MADEDQVTGFEPGLSGAFYDGVLEQERKRRVRTKIFRPDALPTGYYTHDEWVDRGYIPLDGEVPDVHVLLCSGHYAEGRYSIHQCREIRGQKAAQRR